MNWKSTILFATVLCCSLKGICDDKKTSAPQVLEVTKSDGYQLSVSTPKATYTFGEPILVKIQIENTSQETVKFFKTSSPSDYKIKVNYADNRIVPLTAYGEIVFDELKPIQNRSFFTLKPQEKLTYQFAINSLFDFSITGKYSISIARNLPNPKDSKEVVSISSKPFSLLVLDLPEAN